MTFKRSVSSMLAILMLMGTLGACASGGSETAATTTADAQGDLTSGESTQTTEEALVFPHPAKEFDGRVFRVLIDQEPLNNLDILDYEIEAQNGEVLNDALYNRQLAIEETYKVKIEAVHTKDIVKDANKIINANVDEYDAFAPRLMNATKFAASGYGVDLLNLQSFAIDSPWWDQNCVREMSVNKHLYFITGDIFYKHYDAIAMIAFNKRLINDYGLENPYDLVKDNTWTLDKFNEMCRSVTKDLNGDGEMDRYDQYGLSTQADDLTSFINGSGETLFKKGADDVPVYAADVGKVTSIIDKVLGHYVDYSFCIHRDAAAASLSQFWVFPEGRSLFMWTLPRYIPMALRDMTDDFGLLPIPKFDAAQPRYYATVNHWHGYGYMIPKTALDFDFSAYIMDALAYEGRKSVLPAYYEICLQRKLARDADSAAMLDVIFSSTIYDFAFLYGIGEFVGKLENSYYTKNAIDYVSTYDKYKDKIATAMDKLMANFNSIT